MPGTVPGTGNAAVSKTLGQRSSVGERQCYEGAMATRDRVEHFFKGPVNGPEVSLMRQRG